MKKITLILMLILLGAGVPQSAVAQILSAPDTRAPGRIAISPYAQSVPSDSYTFIGVSHPSLNTAKTQIGVVVEVLNMGTVPDNAAGRATVFTVTAGETHRVFVVPNNHSVINLSNSSFTDSRTHLIFAQNSAQFGQVRVTGVNEAPEEGVQRYNASTEPFVFDNLAQLNLWGVVYVESSGTGFAMEFVGDAHDSSILMPGNTDDDHLIPATGVTTGRGRGIN